MTAHTKTDTHLHFDLSFLDEHVPVKLHVGKHRVVLKRHTADTLEAHRALNKALRLIPDKNITHFAEAVSLPTSTAQLLLVTAPSKNSAEKLDTMLLSMIHVPRAAREKSLHNRIKQAHKNIQKPHPKLAHYGVMHSAADDPSPIIDVHDFKTAMDAAISLVFHHVELTSIAGNTSATVTDIIEYSNGISDLAMQILMQAQAHQKNPAKQNWVFSAPYLDANLQPTSTNYYAWSDITKEWVTGPMKDSVKQAKNDPSLLSTATNAGVYTVQKGKTDVSASQQQAVNNKKTAQLKSGTSDYWTLNNLTPQHGYEQTSDVTFSDNKFYVEFTNNWLRWLSGYVEFYGPDGSTPVEPENWTSMVPGGLAGVYDSATKKYVQIFSSVNTILAIPVGNTPSPMTFPWPSNASSVKLMAGGIGRTGGIAGQDGHYYGSWDKQVCTPGAIMTGIFNFGIPTACLLMGAAVANSSLTRIAQDIFSTVLDIAVAIVNGPVSSAIQGGNTTTLMTAFADLIPRLLLDCAELAAWMDAEIAEAAAEEATPIFGWIAMAVSVITDVAQLTETSVEVASSPAVFEFMASRTIDAQWTLTPDVNHQNTWPLEATHYDVVATYSDGTSRSTSGRMLSSPQTGPITVYFNKDQNNRLPAGGTVTFTARFYSDNGWLAGLAKAEPINANISGNLLTVPSMAITENLVPLTSTTVYQFDQTLAFDEASQQYEWTNEGGSPTATVKNLSSSNVGNNLAALTNITLNQQTSRVGYTWEASGQHIPLIGQSSPFSGQMFTFQSIDDRSDPGSGLQFVPAGFTAKPMLLFDLNGPADGTGKNVWIDPRQSLYHIRPVTLSGTQAFDLSTGASWGRFNQQIDAAVVHPSGYVVGISTANSKIEILKFGDAPVSDTQAPLANIYSGYGTRVGLIHIPVGVAALSSAGFVVLEAADSSLADAGARIQAFDLFGNPAPVFADNSAVASLKQENLPVTLLDIAVESKGYIYVLKYLNEGSDVSDYRLDIYNPDGTWLSQTAGLVAARMTVDIWRTMYTLNFALMAKPADGRSEPSVSIWLPSPPTSQGNAAALQTEKKITASKKQPALMS